MQRREKKTSKVCVRSAPFVFGQLLLYIAPICSDLLTEHQELAKVQIFHLFPSCQCKVFLHLYIQGGSIMRLSLQTCPQSFSPVPINARQRKTIPSPLPIILNLCPDSLLLIKRFSIIFLPCQVPLWLLVEEVSFWSSESSPTLLNKTHCFITFQFEKNPGFQQPLFVASFTFSSPNCLISPHFSNYRYCQSDSQSAYEN